MFKEFLRSWQTQTASQSATLTVLVGTYTVVVLTLLIQSNLDGLLSRWGRDVKVSVYLKEGLDQTNVSLMQKRLGQIKGFTQVKYVSKEAALEYFQKRLGSLSPTLAADKNFENPLPASFEVILDSQIAQDILGQLPKIAKELSLSPEVEDVSYGQGWVENYASVLKVFRISSWGLVLVLCLGSLFVVGNSIKSSIMVRREEIEVLELVGATQARIAAPYVFEGALLGFLGAVGALLFSAIIFSWQSKILVSGLGFWGLSDQLSLSVQ